MEFGIEIKELIEAIQTRWHRRSTLVLVLFGSAGALLWFFSAIDLGKIPLLGYLIAAVVLGLITLVWFRSARVPQARKGSVGFAVAVSAETEKQHERVTHDFVDTLKRLLAHDSVKYRFSFVEFPEHLATKITTVEDALRYLEFSKCRFMIFGKACIRTIQGREQHVLNLQGVVKHRPLPKEISKNLSTEFSELFPNRVFIAPENDLFSFEFTSEWVNFVARYIIGIAAFLSGDIEYPQSLFEDLQQKVEGVQTNFPAITKIRQRLPARLSEIYTANARLAELKWRKNRSSEFLTKMKIYLDKLQGVAPDSYEGHLLRGIWHFVARRDTAAARKEILSCKGVQDATWRYSDAFLLAYDGDMGTAVKRYHSAFKRYCDPNVPFEVEEFICWILNQEPDRIQLYFCLGLINLFAKDDRTIAVQDFEKFLEIAPPNQFNEAKRLAEEYLRSIRGKKD